MDQTKPTEDTRPPEDFAQLIAAIKTEYEVTESEIARRLGIAPATVNAWALRKRGTKRGPNPAILDRLHQAFPKFTRDRIAAAAGRKAPGPLSPDAKERLLRLFEELTEEQQTLIEMQVRAVVESNRPGSS